MIINAYLKFEYSFSITVLEILSLSRHYITKTWSCNLEQCLIMDGQIWWLNTKLQYCPLTAAFLITPRMFCFLVYKSNAVWEYECTHCHTLVVILILIIIFLKHAFPYLNKSKLLFTIVIVSCSLQDLKCQDDVQHIKTHAYSSWEMLTHPPIMQNVI